MKHFCFHAGECLLFHAIASPGTLQEALKEGSWKDLSKMLPPSVVRYQDTFYLFVCGWNGQWDRTEIQGAYQHKTYVYQSNDPLKFDPQNEVAVLDAHAPEIFQDEVGDWFISSVEWPHRGVSIARLVWE